MRRCSLWVAAVCFFAVGGGEASAVNPRSLHAFIADLLTARYGEAWMTHPTSFRKEDD